MSKAYRYQQLESWLLEGITGQRWRVGERLPSVRDMCREQQVSKATVLHAYQRLEARGLLEARPKSGYFVLPDVANRGAPHIVSHAIVAPAPVTVSDVVMDVMDRGAAFDILPELRGLELQAGRDTLYSRSVDQNRKMTSPANHAGITALNRSIGRALRSQSDRAHQYYDEPAGDAGLREQLAQRYRRHGCESSADDFCITAGCQQSLFLALMACCQRGDIVAVESPGFYGVLQLLEQLGLQVVEIPASAVTGMDTEALERALQQWSIRACVVTPAFATPTGATLPSASRQTLLALADQYDLALIEDDIYGDLGFFGRPDPLKAQDKSDRVILCSSFSKSLSRDVRIGWIEAGRWHHQVKRLKLVTSLASSRFVQQGLASFIKDGGYDTHLRRQREQLRQQRNELVEFLDKHWPKEICFSVPEGGLALWLQLPQGINTLSAYGAALNKGVVITPGALFSSTDHYRNCLRLSFLHPLTASRQEALKILMGVLSH
ncbi:PLP-dependent aminotransferase family protein [Neptunomonas antarctica]|uniref:Transcriptional regulator, GntR family n=1 Tax=Neptunomonas antarctica TaxID=619304 RepID=A0A1N7L4T4_9GAMM|nr:PLP-dependent aminotransferase family protein [Neptunomonas antarctica]SIS68859.1 transcriptional regulator, GntR family [Neptunomonas antarctica]